MSVWIQDRPPVDRKGIQIAQLQNTQTRMSAQPAYPAGLPRLHDHNQGCLHELGAFDDAGYVRAEIDAPSLRDELGQLRGRAARPDETSRSHLDPAAAAPNALLSEELGGVRTSIDVAETDEQDRVRHTGCRQLTQRPPPSNRVKKAVRCMPYNARYVTWCNHSTF